MKVYVGNKDIEENELLNTDEYDIVITKYREDFWEEEVYPEIKSLEQHDAEIRKQAKQEVIDELLKFINTEGIIRKSKPYFVNGYDFAQEQIKQKLNEMKEV